MMRFDGVLEAISVNNKTKRNITKKGTSLENYYETFFSDGKYLFVWRSPRSYVPQGTYHVKGRIVGHSILLDKTVYILHNIRYKLLSRKESN